MFATQSDGAHVLGVVAAIVGASAGVGLHALGTFIAAAGEAMFAVMDTAIYGRRTALALEAKGKRRSK